MSRYLDDINEIALAEGADHQRMNGRQMNELRQFFGMGRRDFADLIGLVGAAHNNWVTVKRYETGQRDIPLSIERLLRLIKWYHHTTGELPDFNELEIS